MTKLFLTIDNDNDKVSLIRTDQVIETKEGFRPQFPNEPQITIPKDWVKKLLGFGVLSAQKAIIQIQEKTLLTENFLLNSGYVKTNEDEYVKDIITIKKNEITKGYCLEINDGCKTITSSQIEYTEQLNNLINRFYDE